jgi:glycerophosphoryl diester phosphodiesterase
VSAQPQPLAGGLTRGAPTWGAAKVWDPMSDHPADLRPLIIAHRGASQGAVDNSLDAFAKAIDLGADLIEFDVRRTRDDQLICFHDAAVARRPIDTLSRQEVTEATGHEPPLLDDVLDLTKDRIGLDVEIKEDGYVDRVMASVAERFDAEAVVITSFLDDVVRQVKQLQPGTRAGLLVGRGKPQPYVRTPLAERFLVSRARACGADLVAMHFTLAPLGVLARTHSAGLDAYVWTVNGDERIRHFLADPRVAALITDRPARALELRGADDRR